MDEDYKDPRSYRDPDVTTSKGRNKETIKWIVYVAAAGVAVPILAFLLSFGAEDRDEARERAALDSAEPVIVVSD